MSRSLRTKINIREKASRLHHNIGKTDNVARLRLFEKVEMPKNILPFYENGALNYSGSAQDLKINFETLSNEDKVNVKTLTLSVNGNLIQ